MSSKVPRPKIKPMGDTDGEINGRESELGPPPSSPDHQRPRVIAKVKTKTPRTSRRKAERAITDVSLHDGGKGADRKVSLHDGGKDRPTDRKVSLYDGGKGTDRKASLYDGGKGTDRKASLHDGGKGTERPSGRLSIASKPASAIKPGIVGKIEIKLPQDVPTTSLVSQGRGGRYNYQLESSELRTLLKLPRDTPSAQVVHRLRESFHFMDKVERYKADLHRLLQTREVKSHEGVLDTVRELILENESLKLNIEHQQEIIAKLQQDKKLVLERFHKLVKEHRIKDYGSSGSLLALQSHESKFTSHEGDLSKSVSGPVLTSSANRLPTSSLTELRVAELGEKRDLATMLSSKIDHMLRPAGPQKTDQTGLSPIYIRRKKNKDEKKMVYKITGVIRPASMTSQRGHVMGGTVMAATTQRKKLPEILARKKTPTPTRRPEVDSETGSDASLTSDTSSSTLDGTDTDGTHPTPRQPASTTHRIRIQATNKGGNHGNDQTKAKSSLNLVRGNHSNDQTQSKSSVNLVRGNHGNDQTQSKSSLNLISRNHGNDQTQSKSSVNLGSMSKRYSSSALSASGSIGHPHPPSSIPEQDESSGDMFGSLSDIKKDDIISLIFAPLLKDRYMSKFTVGSAGGVLTMQEIGVTMVIPPGAIATGQTMDIILGISYNPIDTPISIYAHTHTAPTILTASKPGLRFKRPVLLAFSHNNGNLGLSTGARGTPRILQSATGIGHTTRWRQLVREDQEEEEEFGCVTGEMVVTFVRELRLVTMVVEQGTCKVPCKYVRVVTYVSYSPGRDCVALHVYCIDNLPSERQLLRRECSESSSGIEVGEQPMVMHGNDGDIIVSIRNVPAGWQLTGQSHQSLSYRKVWQNLHPHVTFVLQCSPDTWESELSCSIHTQQLKTDDKDANTDIAICCDLAQMEGCSESGLFDSGGMSGGGLRAYLHTQHSDFFTPSVFDAGGSMLLHDTESDQIGDDLRELLFNIAWPRSVQPHNIPPSLVSEVAAMLDPANLLGLDWRQLASELDMDGCVPALSVAGRPTEHLMLAAEVLCSGLYELQANLERMGRDDVSLLVQAYIARREADNSHTRNNTGVIDSLTHRLPHTSRF